MLITVEHLRIAFKLNKNRLSVPVRDVSFNVPKNSRIALVGESGCGKSLTALSLGGLVDRAEITGKINGSPRIAYIFQNPMQSLNPVMKVGKQIEEAMREKKSVEKLLEDVGLDRSVAKKYSCQLSGGQQQRVMIAMALASDPDLLIADEPTTALDVTTQKEVLDLISRVANEREMSVLLITHNLGLVARYSDYVHVMYAGEIVESGEVKKVLSNPRHPYTQGLLAAVPSINAPKDAPLKDIPGTVPSPTNWPEGCAFHPRCPKAKEKCKSFGAKCGSALLFVLMTIAVLSILVMSFVYEAHQQSGINIYVRERNRVLRVVEGGQAIAEILMTKYKDVVDWTEGEDLKKLLEDDRWLFAKRELKDSGSCMLGPILLDDTRDKDGAFLNPMTVTIEISPANDDKININHLWKNGGDSRYAERWWMIFKDHNIPEELSTPKDGTINLWNILIASWDDWRDEDDTVTAIDGEECGAENQWYEEYEKDHGLDKDDYREFRRRPRNGPIPDVHELENIRGFREYPAVLTGGVLNPWEDREEDQIEVKGILDVLCADGPQKINVNSCKNTSVLITIPGIYEQPEKDDVLEEARGVANDVINSISKMPEDRDVDETLDAWPYIDWSDLQERVDDDVGNDASQYFVYNSEQFRVKIIGESMGMVHSVEAKCYIKDGKVRYYEWCENPVETTPEAKR